MCPYFADCIEQEDRNAWVLSVRAIQPVPGLPPSTEPKRRPPFRRMRVIFIDPDTGLKVLFDTYGPVGGTHVFAMDYAVIQCLILCINHHHNCPWSWERNRARCRCEWYQFGGAANFYRPGFKEVEYDDWPKDEELPWAHVKLSLYKMQNKRQAQEASDRYFSTWAAQYFGSDGSDYSDVSSDYSDESE